MLGRYNGTWLILCTKADVKNFDGKPIEPEKPQTGSFFKETFGTGTYPSGKQTENQ
jgi:hypothetical protein